MKLKQNVATEILVGPFVSCADGATPVTGLAKLIATGIRLFRNGVWHSRHSSENVSYTENGYYTVPLDADDLSSIGLLVVAVSLRSRAPLHIPIRHDCEVLREKPLLPMLDLAISRIDDAIRHLADLAADDDQAKPLLQDLDGASEALASILDAVRNTSEEE